MFLIEDEVHAEAQGEFRTREEALAELRRRAAIPWDQEPNRAPCTGWQTCGRRYALVEYSDDTIPWKVISRVAILEVSSMGALWVTPEATAFQASHPR
jgi:hypothetical protein